jgi:hypothetical protein
MYTDKNLLQAFPDFSGLLISQLLSYRLISILYADKFCYW